MRRFHWTKTSRLESTFTIEIDIPSTVLTTYIHLNEFKYNIISNFLNAPTNTLSNNIHELPSVFYVRRLTNWTKWLLRLLESTTEISSQARICQMFIGNFAYTQKMVGILHLINIYMSKKHKLRSSISIYLLIKLSLIVILFPSAFQRKDWDLIWNTFPLYNFIATLHYYWSPFFEILNPFATDTSREIYV